MYVYKKAHAKTEGWIGVLEHRLRQFYRKRGIFRIYCLVFLPYSFPGFVTVVTDIYHLQKKSSSLNGFNESMYV